MKHPRLQIASAVFVTTVWSLAARAAPSNDEMNAANNPLQPTLGVNFQDYYTGSYYGPVDDDGNSLLLRGVMPHKLFGLPQIVRATLPITTTPKIGNADSVTGVGDLNLFDIFIFKVAGVEYGIGPQLTAPTASKDETGTGKWQAGLAGLAMAPQKWGMIGGLLTWQTSFAGDSDRPNQNNLQAQPFFIYNFPEGWYARSTATWNFNLRGGGDYYIPIGVGAGKIWKDGKTTLNLFAEPQWTVAHSGNGVVPNFQLFFGLNLQFPL